MISGKQWHICDDCLDPLAHDLLSVARRFYVTFDAAKRAQLDRESGEIEAAGYGKGRLTEAQRNRLDDLSKQRQAQAEPPCARDVDLLYRRYGIERAIDRIKFNDSMDFGDAFERKLLNVQKRFSNLEFRASQIINGDERTEGTIKVRNAIQRLIASHDKQLHQLFPEHESHPERDELPAELRAFEVEILDEYTEIQYELRDVSNYLRRVSALVREKARGSEIHRQIGQTESSGSRLVVESSGKEWFGILDEKRYSIRPKAAKILKLLLDANGEIVNLSGNGFRTRDRKGLPDAIEELIETHPGAGSRIPRDRLQASIILV